MKSYVIKLYEHKYFFNFSLQHVHLWGKIIDSISDLQSL